jgi:hypothetical protein
VKQSSSIAKRRGMTSKELTTSIFLRTKKIIPMMLHSNQKTHKMKSKMCFRNFLKQLRTKIFLVILELNLALNRKLQKLLLDN